MRNLLLCAWMFNNITSSAEGCTGVHINLNNSTIIYAMSAAPTILMSEADSLSFYAYGGGGTTVAWVKLYWNDSLIYQASAKYMTVPKFNFAQREGTYKAVLRNGCKVATETSYFHLTKNITNVSESERRSEPLSIRPNPVSDKIIVDFSEEVNASCEILSLDGKSIEIINQESTSIEIPVETLPKGIYLLRIQTNNRRIITKKIVVAH